MRSWIKPLSSEAEDLLTKERALEAAPADVLPRALARARAAHRHVGSLPERVSLRRRPGFIAAALVFAVAAVSFAAWQNWPEAAPPAHGVSPPLPNSAPASSPAPWVPESEPAPPRSPGAQPPQAPEKRPAASSSSAADAYALELKVLERARAAAAGGDFAASLRAIANHQRRFPAGRLLEEREALRVKALAGLGRAEEARRAAEGFRERFPRSVLSDGIQETAKPK